MSLSGITTKEESFFTVTESRDLSRTKEYCTRLKTIVTMSLNAKNVNRGVYTFWNVISDVGGLYGVLSVAGTIIISIFGYKKAKNYLASQLYKASRSGASDKNPSLTTAQLNANR